MQLVTPLDAPAPDADATGLTATDLFCGAGGSSIGLHAAGVRTVIAANHWQLAVDTHQDNFPDADHDCADLSQVDPRRYPPTDLLWGSPECTNHSPANGKKRATASDPGSETAERSRATMWDIVRFLEGKQIQGHPYKAAIVENVVDAAKWVLFPAWRAAIEALGYDVHPVYLNSMFAWSAKATPAPQSRDRVYFVILPRGTRVDLDIRPPAYCPQCETDVAALQTWKKAAAPWGRYRAQYVYTCPNGHGRIEPYALPAATAIDWSLMGERIGDRARPLAENTITRIQAGLRKYADMGPQSVMLPPGFLHLFRSGRARSIGFDEPLATVVADGSNHGMVTPPMLMRGYTPRGGDGCGQMLTPVSEPARTMAAKSRQMLVVPPAFLATLRGGGTKHDGTYPVADSLATFSAAGTHHGLIVPPKMVMSYYRTGQALPASMPITTQGTHDTSAVIDPAELVDDCLFRMLAPHEIGAGMAFPADYRVRGRKTDRVRMYGNAVTPPASTLLMGRVADALNGTVEDAA